MKASIVIPTVDRRIELARAIDGCVEQSFGGDFEVLVVDNSRLGSQRWVLDRDRNMTAPHVPLRYFHEPFPGLAHARNAGVRCARGEFIVFLDDDEEPDSPGWLSHILRAVETSGADAAFGPVIPQLSQEPAALRDYVEDVFTRDLKVEEGADVSLRRHLLGSGNSCFRASTCFAAGKCHFDERFDATGGEDTEFIRRLATSGKRLVWAPAAVVSETVPIERTTPESLKARRFAQGQMRSSANVRSAPRRYDLLLLWMAGGLLQWSFHLVFGLSAKLFGREEAAMEHFIEARGGLGKVLWQERFRRRRYGASATAKS